MMKVLALIENTTASDKLNCEHGLSLYIELNDEHYLLDSGASGKLTENAKKMNVPLNKVKKIAVSHNHSDHTGGLETLIKKYPDVKIFARKECDADYCKKVGVFKFPLGQIKQLKSKYPHNFILYNKFQEIGENFFMMGNEVPDMEFYCCDKSLMKNTGEDVIPDTFEHEAFGVVFPMKNRKSGYVILSPCSHSGIVNIIKTAKNTWPSYPVLAVIGGFHTMKSSTKKLNCPPEYIEKSAAELKALDIGTIYTCHCTGMKGYEEFKKYLGDQIQYLQTGEELEF